MKVAGVDTWQVRGKVAGVDIWQVRGKMAILWENG
jgi:hypothetical protein